MQLLVDYLPLLLFFIAYKRQGIYVATPWRSWRRSRRSRCLHRKTGELGMNWLSLAIIGVFGGATLVLHDRCSSGGSRRSSTPSSPPPGRRQARFRRHLLARRHEGHHAPAAVWTWSRGRGSRSSRSWVSPTGTSLSVIRATRGSISRCGAASDSSWGSRSSRASGAVALCDQETE